jgi:hypothetical protein
MIRVIIAALFGLMLWGCPTNHGAWIRFTKSTTPSVTQYFIYRDGIKVTTVPATTTSYFDSAPAGKHSYFLTAYNGKESVHSNTVTAIVP